MNINNQIGIEKTLRDEMVYNYIFKHGLLECIKNNNVLNWGIIDEKTKRQNKEYLKNGAGILESEYKTTIGNITIYTDIKKVIFWFLKRTKQKKTAHLVAQTSGKCKAHTNTKK